MKPSESKSASPRPSGKFLPKDQLDALVGALRERGYMVIAPVIVEGVIMLRPITSADKIARGVRDEQEGGRYRLHDSDPDFYFQYVVGPDSPKRFFFPPQQRLFSLHIEGERFVLDQGRPQAPKLAFIGVRGCELAAIGVQDRTFGIEEHQGTFRCESEDYYQQAREQSFMVAVNCTRPGETCFCTSWNSGPEATEGYDLSITELKAGFVIRAGSDEGEQLLRELPVIETTDEQLEVEDLKLKDSADHMGRRFDPTGVKELLDQSIEHPHWDEVAQRCLSCGNCTMVCPTCFCSTVVDSNDLATNQVTRTREWESCFTQEFSYTTGGPERRSTRAQYRHWLRHKLCTWWDQFDMSGCTGCGRCITWCPVGIDLTQEVEAIRLHPGRPDSRSAEPGEGSDPSGITPVQSSQKPGKIPGRASS